MSGVLSSKKLMIVMLLILALTLSACGGSPSKPGAVSEVGGFVGGNNGFGINVLVGAPPDVIQDRGATPFSFVLTLENIGEAKVGPGTDNPLIVTRLTGIRPKDFGLTDESAARVADFTLEPAKRNFDSTIMPGEINYVNYDNLAYKEQVLDSQAITIRAEVCYDYESYATTKLCFKKDVIESNEDLSICALNSARPVGNSGSPIHITAVEQKSMNDKSIRVTFRLEHVGKGVFFYRNEPKDNYDSCDFNEANQNIFKLDVEITPTSKDLYSFECQRLDPIAGGGARGSVKMSGGAPTTVTCIVTRNKIGDVRVYEDLFNIKLRYRYGEFIEKPILVQDHP